MKNQNSYSKPIVSDSNKEKPLLMDSEIQQQQINNENFSQNSTDTTSVQFHDKVNKK